MKLEIGKIPNDLLDKLLSHCKESRRAEVLSQPKVGEDCAVIDFSQDLCVITTDPITGADDEIGTLGVHISCNDLASAGAEPVGLVVTVLAPENTELDTLDRLMQQINEAAAELKADIIGGHTEITDAVNRIVLSITAIGKVKREQLVTTQGAKPGDAVILTKYAATEGTAILAYLFEQELTREFGEAFVESSKKLLGSISVVPEGLLASRYGVNAMHDVTEGGVLGASWEIHAASGYGVEIDKKRIPILEETRRICQFLSLDPLRLISSGCMLITTPNGPELIRILHESNIKASIIGEVTFGSACVLKDDDEAINITAPEADELYKARKMKGLV
ncbi:MAG: AIR synthase family protein [Clostridia bacterium]|nr:AIR synthase family protein [Clostridia bacterium]